MNIDAYNSGANMALKAFGIVNEQQQMQMLQQLRAQQAQNMQIENAMRMMQMQKIDADTKKTAQMEAAGQKITELLTPTPRTMVPQQKPFEEGGVAGFQGGDVSPLNRQTALAMAAGLNPKEFAQKLLTPTAWHPQSMEEAIQFEQAKAGLKPNKPVSMGNAAEAAMNEEFPNYMNDPKTLANAQAWLGTEKGKQKVAEWATRLTPPSFTFPVTDQGIVTAQTRGPGAGRVIGPTGYGKPLTDAQLSKVGELNAVLSNIGKTKELYAYGTGNEHAEWVGPIAGRKGGLEAKYTGTATPDQVKFYAYVKDMQDALLRARSGAQINEQEYKRLVNFLPDPNLPAITFKAKLDRFEEATRIVMEEKLSAFEKGGYGIGGLGGSTTQPSKSRFKILEVK